MTYTLPAIPAADESSTVQTCRHQNQAWATALAQNEQEIDQLLTLITDVAEQPDYRRLDHQPVNYVNSLTLLKGGFRQIRFDMVCEKNTCSSAMRRACREPRFGVYPLIEGHCRPLTDELGRVRTECCQFLGGLVTLNRI